MNDNTTPQSVDVKWGQMMMFGHIFFQSGGENKNEHKSAYRIFAYLVHWDTNIPENTIFFENEENEKINEIEMEGRMPEKNKYGNRYSCHNWMSLMTIQSPWLEHCHHLGQWHQHKSMIMTKSGTLQHNLGSRSILKRIRQIVLPRTGCSQDSFHIALMAGGMQIYHTQEVPYDANIAHISLSTNLMTNNESLLGYCLEIEQIFGDVWPVMWIFVRCVNDIQKRCWASSFNWVQAQDVVGWLVNYCIVFINIRDMIMMKLDN